MHTGEEWFHFTWIDYSALAVILGVYLVLVFTNRLPSIKSFQEFVSAFNTPGGHVLTLSFFTAWSIRIAMQFFYHILSLPEATITKQQNTISVGIGFATGTLGGAFIGALFKTMTGAEKPNDVGKPPAEPVIPKLAPTVGPPSVAPPIVAPPTVT